MASNSSMYLEDWIIGKVYTTEFRTITMDDITSFGAIEGSNSPMHLDEEYAINHTIFGGLSAHGLLILTIAFGLMGKMGLFGEALAQLETHWTFRAPVLLNDQIRARWFASEVRETNRPERGVLVRNVSILNQNDVEVCRGTITGLWSRRPQS